jgi:hypothetical protein
MNPPYAISPGRVDAPALYSRTPSARSEATSRGYQSEELHRKNHVRPRIYWVEDIYSALAKGQTDAALDLLLDRLDDALSAGDLAQCEEALVALDVGRLNIEACLTVLAVTRAARQELRGRASFLKRAEGRVSELAPDRAEVLLQGLR